MREDAGFFEGDDAGAVAGGFAVFFAELDEAFFVFEEGGGHDEGFVFKMTLF